MVSYFVRLRLVAILGGLAHSSQAQLSTLPKRYRRTQRLSNSQTTSGNVAASPVSVERRQMHNESIITVKRKARQLGSEEELSLSMPLQSATFELSISMPYLEESEFELSSMSLSLEQAELSLSMSLPMFEDRPTENLGEQDSEVVSVDRSKSSSTLILCSFIAGLSALVVGATAMFLKMQRVHALELEQSELRYIQDV